MKKAYFQYYETFENVLEKIKDDVAREHFRRAIIRYGLYGVIPGGLTEIEEMAWTICKDLIDQQQHRRQVNADNARARKAAESEKNTPAENKETKKKAARFEKPTLEEVAAYIKEKGYGVNPESFYSYYEANGWKIGGRAPMKSWTAAVQSWSAREKKGGGTIYQNGDKVADEYGDLF